MKFSKDIATTIARRHGIGGEVELLPNSGMVNEAWLLDGKFVLRITIEAQAFDEAEREAFVVPLARAAGVLTPDLIAVDTTQELVNAPYTIYERAEGELLGSLDTDPNLFEEAYRETGRQFALIHSIDVPEADRHRLHRSFEYDSDKQLLKALNEGKLLEDRAEIEKWERRLADLHGEPSQYVFLHQDVHPWNMFVSGKSLTAIIDWGDAAFGDRAGEFASMPYCAVRPMFEGYKEAGGSLDESALARSLHCGLALAIWEARALEVERFRRQWWRLPPGGFPEMFAIFDSLLSSA